MLDLDQNNCRFKGQRSQPKACWCPMIAKLHFNHPSSNLHQTAAKHPHPATHCTVKISHLDPISLFPMLYKCLGGGGEKESGWAIARHCEWRELE